MKRILVAYVAAMFCLSGISQNGVTLKMNPEKNKVYRFKSSSEQTIVQTINGNQQTVESKTANTVSIKMIDITPDFLIAEVHLDSMSVRTNSMGKATNMNSASEGDIKSTETSMVMSFIMNRISKNPLYIKMDFTGRVIDIVNAKMISDVILKDTSNLALTGALKKAIKSQIENMVSVRTLSTTIEIFTNYLPAKQVNKGDTWNKTVTTMSGGMALEINTNFRLDDINGNTTNVTAESTIQAATNALPMQQGPAKIAYDNLKGLSKSTLVIDAITGLVLVNKAKTHIAGNLGISGPGFSMEMPMDINGESKVIAIM